MSFVPVSKNYVSFLSSTQSVKENSNTSKAGDPQGFLEAARTLLNLQGIKVPTNDAMRELFLKKKEELGYEAEKMPTDEDEAFELLSKIEKMFADLGGEK